MKRALLLHPSIGRVDNTDRRREFQQLVESAGFEIAVEMRSARTNPEPRYLIGSGTAAEMAALVRQACTDLVVINHDLSPLQERDLERLCGCPVLDRSALILDIFAQRARSHEGKLQVELAQLERLSTRLVRGWTHLERQKGGIGLRGPGETQLETDRRLVGQRVKQLRRRLKGVEKRRETSRRRRTRRSVPTVALVGYTNAGKSTLFNVLSEGGSKARNRLFETLDPTVRRLQDVGREVALADTVGFISELPHELVAAFRATLDETRDADLLLHVIDATEPNPEELRAAVHEVLLSIGAEDVPILEVWNKIDRSRHQPGCDHSDRSRCFVSATTGAGLAELRELISLRLAHGHERRAVHVPPSEGALRSKLLAAGAVRDECAATDGGWDLVVELSPMLAGKWRHKLDRLAAP